MISEGRDVAVGCPASDSETGNLGVTVLTRPARPQGEGVVTDNPGNVIPVEQWKPVRYAAETPLGGVRLGDGLFKRTMENNVRYLLDSFTADEMLHAFRQRAGRPMPPLSRPLDPFWFGELPGSAAGRFLMGAGNTLRWMDNAELRRRLDEIVDGIADCRRPDGYIMAYNEDTIFTSERAAYTRAWVTHGLIDAGLAGNAKAWSLLRGYYDWFDRCPYLPEVMRRGHQGIQGMIANTRMYFTPVGRPEDLQVIQRYFQENYWLDQLAAREDRAIWLYPYDRPHCYLLTSIEPYLDLYRATGAKKYLDAALGAWQLYHDKWEHVGGSIAICEDTIPYPPKSYCLHRNTGELCGSVFWVKLSQRLHLLFPEEEKYVNEIEKSIYNVGIANQVGGKGIRYTARLVGHKDHQPAALHEHLLRRTRDAVVRLAAGIHLFRRQGRPLRGPVRGLDNRVGTGGPTAQVDHGDAIPLRAAGADDAFRRPPDTVEDPRPHPRMGGGGHARVGQRSGPLPPASPGPTSRSTAVGRMATPSRSPCPWSSRLPATKAPSAIPAMSATPSSTAQS